MTSILLSSFEPQADWNQALSAYLRDKTVFVLAFSDYPGMINRDTWSQAYGAPNGQYYQEMMASFASYQVKQVVFANYFKDSTSTLKKAIESADVVMLPGGAPDALFDRLKDKGLIATIKAFKGTMIGFSAGAMVQLEIFHLTPDEVYPEFYYHEGLSLIKQMDIEVHYQAENQVQVSAIKQVLKDKGYPVYAIGNQGALLVKDGQIQTLGDVHRYLP